jgi:hypothetical protein
LKNSLEKLIVQNKTALHANKKACTSPSKIKTIIQSQNRAGLYHSVTKVFLSSLYPNQHSAYQHQKSFGSVINFIASIKNLLKEQVLITTSGSGNH